MRRFAHATFNIPSTFSTAARDSASACSVAAVGGATATKPTGSGSDAAAGATADRDHAPGGNAASCGPTCGSPASGNAARVGDVTAG